MIFFLTFNTFLCAGFSRQIIQILKDHNIQYSSFDILSDEEVRQGLKIYSNWPTFPQVYVNGEIIGGLDIVKVQDTRSSVLFFEIFLYVSKHRFLHRLMLCIILTVRVSGRRVCSRLAVISCMLLYIPSELILLKASRALLLREEG